MISVENVILPSKRLNNFELEDAAKRLEIPSFRGVFLLATLLKKLNKKECGIVNVDHLCLYLLKELDASHKFQIILNKLF